MIKIEKEKRVKKQMEPKVPCVSKGLLLAVAQGNTKRAKYEHATQLARGKRGAGLPAKEPVAMAIAR
jgi:hypothetical protein